MAGSINASCNNNVHLLLSLWVTPMPSCFQFRGQARCRQEASLLNMPQLDQCRYSLGRHGEDEQQQEPRADPKRLQSERLPGRQAAPGLSSAQVPGMDPQRTQVMAALQMMKQTVRSLPLWLNSQETSTSSHLEDQNSLRCSPSKPVTLVRR